MFGALTMLALLLVSTKRFWCGVCALLLVVCGTIMVWNDGDLCKAQHSNAQSMESSRNFVRRLLDSGASCTQLKRDVYVQRHQQTKHIAVTTANKGKMYNTSSGQAMFVDENGATIDLTGTTSYCIPTLHEDC